MTENPEILIENSILEEIKTLGKVILFNDEWHTFEDVINQLILAINCSIEKAQQLTFEVHNNGKSCVFEGELNQCLRVSSILEEIELHTQIIF